MSKIFRKILPSFLLTAIILIAGGFFGGIAANAQMEPMSNNVYIASQTMHHIVVGPILRQDMPIDNSVKPCCENQQGGASSIQTLAFNQDLKFSAIDNSEDVINSNSIFEHKILELSSASPPKPDILSSIFLKE